MQPVNGTSGPGRPFARTVRVEIPGIDLGDYEPWQDPSTEHPRGTVVALGYPVEGHDAPALVEIDVTSGALVGRHSLGVGVVDAGTGATRSAW